VCEFFTPPQIEIDHRKLLRIPILKFDIRSETFLSLELIPMPTMPKIIAGKFKDIELFLCNHACPFRRGAPGVSDGRGPSLSFTGMPTQSGKSATPARTAVYTFARLTAAFSLDVASVLRRAPRGRGRSHSTPGAVRGTASDSLSATHGTLLVAIIKNRVSLLDCKQFCDFTDAVDHHAKGASICREAPGTSAHL
jgi:hypothetical protein